MIIIVYHCTVNGQGYQPTANMLEEENERMEQELSNKVQALKSVKH